MIVPRHNRPPQILCDYCQQEAKFHENSTFLYGRNYGPVWHCVGCQAWVGCHPCKTNKKGALKPGRPLGRFANKELRQAKMRAHAAFDPLWKAKMQREDIGKGRARAAGYAWLAASLGIDPVDCHIGMFDVAMCSRVVEVCTAREKIAA